MFTLLYVVRNDTLVAVAPRVFAIKPFSYFRTVAIVSPAKEPWPFSPEALIFALSRRGRGGASVQSRLIRFCHPRFPPEKRKISPRAKMSGGN